MTMTAAVYLFPAFSVPQIEGFSLLVSVDTRVLVVLLEGEGSTDRISCIQFTPILLFCKLKKEKVIKGRV